MINDKCAASGDSCTSSSFHCIAIVSSVSVSKSPTFDLTPTFNPISFQFPPVPVELLSLLPLLLQLLTPLLSNQSPPSTLSPSTTPPTLPPRPTTHHHHFPFGGPLAFPSFAYGAYGAGFPPFPDYHFPAAYPAFSGEWLVFYFMVD